jgi:hypothetical protein
MSCARLGPPSPVTTIARVTALHSRSTAAALARRKPRHCLVRELPEDGRMKTNAPRALSILLVVASLAGCGGRSELSLGPCGVDTLDCVESADDPCGPPRMVSALCDASVHVYRCPAGAWQHARAAEPAITCRPFSDPAGGIQSLGGSLLRLPTDDGRCLWIAESVKTTTGTRVSNVAFEPDRRAPFGTCPTAASIVGGSPSSVVQIEGGAAPDLVVQIDAPFRFAGRTRVVYRFFHADPTAAYGFTLIGGGARQVGFRRAAHRHPGSADPPLLDGSPARRRRAGHARLRLRVGLPEDATGDFRAGVRGDALRPAGRHPALCRRGELDREPRRERGGYRVQLRHVGLVRGPRRRLGEPPPRVRKRFRFLALQPRGDRARGSLDRRCVARRLQPAGERQRRVARARSYTRSWPTRRGRERLSSATASAPPRPTRAASPARARTTNGRASSGPRRRRVPDHRRTPPGVARSRGDTD